ncbi:MAG: UDP-N-acetylglucosamine--N-acetylmuramyl-(pentapeptide) pyrophosphoryl-undecaprenol N-acetylglucosamine transferase, partial [Parcubacteria group bacterium]|nr:UDP-N-acetylglucosamine--N-acetylmuramyl-(pentapeptide) pyrophosphoryl-undecaprenol N-acetylglucosamine transferase [Parcubacteria group bacterium]
SRRRTPLELGIIAIGPATFGLPYYHAHGVPVRNIITGKYHRHAPWTIPFHAVKGMLGLVQSLFLLWWHMPDVIFSKGGYGAFPTLVAGVLYRIPIVLHESDAIPGLVTRLIGKFARRVCISFRSAEAYFHPDRTVFTGIPLRAAILSGPSQEEGRTYFRLQSDNLVLFTIGGSQGAQPLNETVIEILPNLVARVQVIHQIGKANQELIELEAREALRDSPYADRYHPYGFLSDEQLRHAYAAADIILSRAGATTLYEMSQAGKPSILIPLPHAGSNHQRENAYQYANTGAAIVLEEQNATPNFLLERIISLLENPDRLRTMRERARQFAVRDSSSQVVSEIIRVTSE